MARTISTSDTISRVIKPKFVLRDEDTDAIIGCHPAAFHMRPEEEQIRAISINLLEIFTGIQTAQLSQIRAHLPLTLTGKYAFGVMNVGEALQTGVTSKNKIRILHAPTKNKDPSHSQIRRLPISKEHSIFALLAHLVRPRMVSVNSVPVFKPPPTVPLIPPQPSKV